MSGKTRIEWADRVWNPVVGCTPVSAGCAHCYAKRIFERFSNGQPFSQVQMHPERLEDPFHWMKPSRVFVNSMSDLFHEDVKFVEILEIWSVMYVAKKHTFLILTKRPARLLEFLKWMEKPDIPSNVWIGVTAENQKAADERIPLLLETPAAVRFVSVEPMLSALTLPLSRSSAPGEGKIDWVICGGETGPGARPMHPDWVRDLRDQCQAAGVPFFFKSWGEYIETYTNGVSVKITDDGKAYFRVGKKAAGRMIDGREWSEFPEVVK